MCSLYDVNITKNPEKLREDVEESIVVENGCNLGIHNAGNSNLNIFK